MITNFFEIVSNLKEIPRQGWINKVSISDPESVADHTYSMTVMAMILSDLNNLNTEKVVKMCLIHDLAESITGDYTINDIEKKQKTTLENKTMSEILSNLPESLDSNYDDIWKEFQENKTDEAAFVHEIDKLEMAMQAKIYSKNHSKEKLQEFFDSARKSIKNPQLIELLTKIINE